ncbi:MAG: hypothetical protein KAR83_05610 [Thermodesulfovibrionales bacterium]|nr:hypothetical protein [Thermodesulfovibrionales bacterium]
MKEGAKQTVRAGAKIGGLAGVILFVVFGLTPALFLGGSGAIMVLAAITGGPVEPSVLMRALIVVLSVTGIMAVAACFTMVGSAVGAGLGYVAEAMSPSRASSSEEPAAKDGNKA